MKTAGESFIRRAIVVVALVSSFLVAARPALALEQETEEDVAAREAQDAKAAKKADANEGGAKPAADNPFARKRWQFGAGVLYDSSRVLDFFSAEIAGIKSRYSYQMEPSTGVLLEVRYGADHTWGFQSILEIQRARTVSGVDITSSAGGTVHGSYTAGSEPKLMLLSVDINVFYKWENFYLPFGINNTGAVVSSGYKEFANLNGSGGAQVGGGWDFNDHLSIEGLLVFRSISAPEYKDPVVGDIKLGVGSMTGVQLVLKALL